MQIEETIRYSCNTRREHLSYIHHSSFSRVLFYFYFSLAKKKTTLGLGSYISYPLPIRVKLMLRTSIGKKINGSK